MFLTLMYITNDVSVACIAQKYGVERIWIDLETIGKEKRQKGLDTVKSHHSIDDISKIKPYLKTSKLMVRVNPWHKGSVEEINKVISSGADIIMLPYWKKKNEVKAFLTAVNGRCKTSLLLETKEAVDIIDQILQMGGFDEIHIGLNDLHLSYGKKFMFELLTDGTVEELCNKFKKSGIPYGFGGIARLGGGLLPAENIIMEHYRLGSSRVILSRSFCNVEHEIDMESVERIFGDNINKLRMYEQTMMNVPEKQFIDNRKRMEELVTNIVEKSSR